jgi:N-sulfoglucosamine sulfohydrolase
MSVKNILLLIADDLGRMLGCYGADWVRTPNIDALAARGTRFDRAFTSTASCSGSRSVVYSGRHTHETGQYGLHHGYHHFQTFSDIETAPALFNQMGWRTGIIGKVHVGPEAVYPWQHREESDSRDVTWVARRVQAFLSQKDARPFFLTVGFIDPHRDATRGGFGDPAGPDPVFACEDVTIPDWLPDLPAVRQELAAYAHSIARMDRGVGLILSALREASADSDTLVCFLSDNGAPFVNSKTTLYEAGIHLPLIVYRPGQVPGVTNPNLVSFTDLPPTWLDWAGGTETPNDRLGRSLLPILEAQSALPDWGMVFGSHTFHEITNYWPTRFLRTERYKYHRNVAWQLPFPFAADLAGSLSWQEIRSAGPAQLGVRPLDAYLHRPPEELYDLQADPQEVKNLVGDAAHAATLTALRSAMDNWQRKTRDPWLLTDGVSERALTYQLPYGKS